MAFFELIKKVGQAFGVDIKPMGGNGIGGFWPDFAANYPGPGLGEAASVNVDSQGNLQARAAVTSDEGSLRDDFSGGALVFGVTGSLSFTNGGTTVVGTGTVFLDEIQGERDYVKLDAHSESAWAQVARVVSDTELELIDPYTGATAAGASSRTKWQTTTGAGGSIGVAASKVSIASGTTSGSKTRITHYFDYSPIVFDARCSVSQRIANQSLRIGVCDDPTAMQMCALVVFDGTDNTKVRLRSAYSSASADTEETLVTLPSGLTTASDLRYQVSLGTNEVTLAVNGIKLAEHYLHLPDPYATMTLVAETDNTGAAGSSTTLAIDVIFASNQDQVEIKGSFIGEAIPVQISEEVHNVYALLTTTTTTADQVICSYTVPTGRTAYLAGWFVSAGIGATDAIPIKIGKNIVTTEPGSPGAVDGNIFRAFSLLNDTREQEDYSFPRPFGAGGDVIKITVTPTGTGSQTWRASLGVVLR